MKDYVSLWFKAYKEMGEDTDIIIESEINSEVKIFSYSHEKGDGSSALFEWARHNKTQIKNLSEDKSFGPPSPLKYLGLIVMFLFRTGSYKNIKLTRYPKVDSGLTFKIDIDSKDSLFASELFDVKKNNAFLLWSLNRTVREFFNWGHGPFRWWIPINMRNEFQVAKNDDQVQKNYVSNFTIFCFENDSLESLRNRLSHHLKNKYYWGTWWWQKISHWISYDLLKKIAIKTTQNSQYAGVLTHLGYWQSENSDLKLRVYANALPSHPIAAAVIFWNQRLHITIRFHSCLNLKSEQVENFKTLWIRNLKKQI